MAGITTCGNDTGHHFTHKWLARHGYANGSAPGLRDFDLVECGIDFRDLSAAMFADIAGIVCSKAFTTAKQQAPVLGFAEIANDEA